MNFEDVKKGKIVFRDDQGEEVSLRTEGEGESGTITMKTKEGVFSMGGKWNPPSWVPSYPGATMMRGAAGTSAEGESGAGSFTTKDSLEKVLDYYEAALKSQGLEVTRQTYSTDGTHQVGILVGQDEGRKRYVNVNAGSQPDGTKVGITFTIKN
jgi:hypothetical protein